MEFSPEELAMYILSLTARSRNPSWSRNCPWKPLPLNHLAGFGGKARVVVAEIANCRSNDNRRDRGGRRDHLRKVVKKSVLTKKIATARDPHIRSHNTSSEKKTGLLSVIRVINKHERLLARTSGLFYENLFEILYWLFVFLWQFTTFFNKNN